MLPKDAGPLAQLAEQGTLNAKVRGSSPWRVTLKFFRFRVITTLHGEQILHAGQDTHPSCEKSGTADLMRCRFSLFLHSPLSIS